MSDRARWVGARDLSPEISVVQYEFTTVLKSLKRFPKKKLLSWVQEDLVSMVGLMTHNPASADPSYPVLILQRKVEVEPRK